MKTAVLHVDPEAPAAEPHRSMADRLAALLHTYKAAGLASLAFLLLMVLSNAVEEEIYSRLPGFDFFWTVALVELAVFAGVSQVSRQCFTGGNRSAEERRTPLLLFFAMGVCMALSTSFGKLAFRYVNFTVGTVLKCNKVLPTMLVAFVYLGKVYKTEEVVAAALMGLSAALFALGASEVDLDFSALGLGCTFLHLLFQSLQTNFQDKALREYHSSIDECMLYANLFGFFVVLVIVVMSGEIFLAIAFFVERPNAMLLLSVRSVTFFMGARAYTMIIKEAGGVAAVTVGTLRKIITILGSFVWYPKPYSTKYPIGGALLVLAFALELQTKLAVKR